MSTGHEGYKNVRKPDLVLQLRGLGLLLWHHLRYGRRPRRVSFAHFWCGFGRSRLGSAEIELARRLQFWRFLLDPDFDVLRFRLDDGLRIRSCRTGPR